MLRNISKLSNYCKYHNCIYYQQPLIHTSQTNFTDSAKNPEEKVSARIAEFRQKLRETTPIKDLGEQADSTTANDDPLPPWPENTNPNTGEVGGPRGPEPTRYGDWERKGRVSDF